MTRCEAYATGLSEGARWAEQDLAEHSPTSIWLNEFSGQLQTANSDSERARILGVLRGYREATRTQLGGRYGT